MYVIVIKPYMVDKPYIDCVFPKKPKRSELRAAYSFLDDDDVKKLKAGLVVYYYDDKYMLRQIIPSQPISKQEYVWKTN